MQQIQSQHGVCAHTLPQRPLLIVTQNGTAAGFLMPTLLLGLVVMGIVLNGFIYFLSHSHYSLSHYTQSRQAFYLAKAGLQAGRMALHQHDPTLCNGQWSVSHPLGRGHFRYRCQHYHPPPVRMHNDMRLSQAIPTGKNTPQYLHIDPPHGNNAIPHYAPVGRLILNGFPFYYTHIQKTAFSWTWILSHTRMTQPPPLPRASLLYQSQWVLEAEGALPDFTHPIARKHLISSLAYGIESSLAVGARLGPTASPLLLRHYLVSPHWAPERAIYGAENAHPLIKIRCPLDTQCWALMAHPTTPGHPLAHTQLIHWDGHHWQTHPTGKLSPYFAAAPLRDMQCMSAKNCWAVGAAFHHHPLIVHWNGKAWSIDPRRTALPYAHLYAIDCQPDGTCWAVGGQPTRNATASTPNHHPHTASFRPDRPAGFATCQGCRPFITRYTPQTGWTVIPTAHFLAVPLYAIDCLYHHNTHTHDCWASGQAGLLLRGNQHGWTMPYRPPMQADLYTVSCATTQHCWAAGEHGTLLHFNGQQWQKWDKKTLAVSPENLILTSVKCTPPHTCILMGYHTHAHRLFLAQWQQYHWQKPPMLATLNAVLYDMAFIGKENSVRIEDTILPVE